MSISDKLMEARVVLNKYGEGEITKDQAYVFLTFIGFRQVDANILLNEEEALLEQEVAQSMPYEVIKPLVYRAIREVVEES